MVGKLIKNEFVNREKPLFLILCGVFLASVVTLLMRTLVDHVPERLEGVFTMLSGIEIGLYVLAMVTAAIACFFLPVMDYRSRFFKDQSYLTHALPVKKGSMIFARMVMDIISIVQIAIVFPVSIMVAAGNREFFKEGMDLAKQLLSTIFQEKVGGELVVFVILVVVGVLIQYLENIWLIICAYTIGHSCFNYNKKLLSIVFYIVLNMALSFIATLVTAGLSFADTQFSQVETAKGFTDVLSTFNLYLGIVNGMQLLFCLVFAFITSYVTTKKLNIE